MPKINIATENQYQSALRRLKEIIGWRPDSPEESEFAELLAAIDIWEEMHPDRREEAQRDSMGN